jgi:hypothetical protein
MIRFARDLENPLDAILVVKFMLETANAVSPGRCRRLLQHLYEQCDFQNDNLIPEDLRQFLRRHTSTGFQNVLCHAAASLGVQRTLVLDDVSTLVGAYVTIIRASKETAGDNVLEYRRQIRSHYWALFICWLSRRK